MANEGSTWMAFSISETAPRGSPACKRCLPRGEIPHGLQRRGSNLGQWSRTLFHRGQRLAQSCPKPLNYSIELSQNLTCSGRDVLDTCQILAGGTLGAGKQHIAVTQAADRT